MSRLLLIGLFAALFLVQGNLGFKEVEHEDTFLHEEPHKRALDRLNNGLAQGYHGSQGNSGVSDASAANEDLIVSRDERTLGEDGKDLGLMGNKGDEPNDEAADQARLGKRNVEKQELQGIRADRYSNIYDLMKNFRHRRDPGIMKGAAIGALAGGAIGALHRHG